MKLRSEISNLQREISDKRQELIGLRELLKSGAEIEKTTNVSRKPSRT